jgi:hypothetical protein
MRHRILIPLLLLPLALAPTASAAPLPNPKTHRIVVPRSIGGVHLGQSLGNAAKAWGGKDVCGKAVCEYGKFGNGLGTATIEADDGVTFFGIFTGIDGNKPSFKGPLMEFETSRGIGLRTPISKLKQAYPQGHEHDGRWLVMGSGKSFMSFGESDVPVNGKVRVDSIAVSDGRG